MATVYANGTSATIAVPASSAIAVYSATQANVYQLVGYPNFPQTKTLLFTVNGGQTISSAFSGAAGIVIEAGPTNVTYMIGTNPTTQQGNANFQVDPVALNATGPLTAAAMVSGIVTSTTAAAVAGTVPIGSVMDAANTFAVNAYFDWAVINTGGNTFTVTAATNHTLVGSGAVATVTSGRFRTRKTAAATFVTYRLA